MIKAEEKNFMVSKTSSNKPISHKLSLKKKRSEMLPINFVLSLIPICRSRKMKKKMLFPLKLRNKRLAAACISALIKKDMLRNPKIFYVKSIHKLDKRMFIPY